jgi:hypothetical protein
MVPFWRGGAKPLGLDIYHGIDRPGTRETESFMEKLAFIRACLSSIRVIMAIMCVPLVEQQHQAAMAHILALEYQLPEARACIWSYPIVPCIKCRHFPRSWSR